MLCTKIRLNERRIHLVSTIHHPNQSQTTVTSTLTASDVNNTNELNISEKNLKTLELQIPNDRQPFNRPFKFQKIANENGPFAKNGGESERRNSASTGTAKGNSNQKR